MMRRRAAVVASTAPHHCPLWDWTASEWVTSECCHNLQPFELQLRQALLQPLRIQHALASSSLSSHKLAWFMKRHKQCHTAFLLPKSTLVLL